MTSFLTEGEIKMVRASFKRPAMLIHTYNFGDHLKTVKKMGS